MRHAVIVEPETDVSAMIRSDLEEDGFRTTELRDGESLLALLRDKRPDIVILALVLPGMSGLDVLREVQTRWQVPTIVVSKKGAETDRIVGLEIGADDYLPKPFSTRELLARIHAVLRRAQPSQDRQSLSFNGLTIDLGARDVLVEGDPVILTAREFDLLAFLAGSPRIVFSAEQLLDRVWGSSRNWQTTATVSEHVYRLRHKLGSAGKAIETVRGAGYRFSA